MLCPKCRQPLDEGDEAYICCADATLQWRCTACAKVSEGFAFPYGLCPHCGGTLEALGERSLEGGEREAIRAAFEIELGGEAFYRRAAAETDEPTLKTLFGRFAAMEAEHTRTLARRYHVAAPPRSAAVDTETAALLAGIDGPPRDAETLFRTAIALERRAVRFFERRAAEAPGDSPQRQLYRELAAEEREHAELLATEHGLWRAGRTGLLGGVS